MEVTVQIPFPQLLKAVKSLSPKQKAQLTQELAREEPIKNDKTAFIEMLLNGPVYTEDEIKIIEQNTESIAAWRTKN